MRSGSEQLGSQEALLPLAPDEARTHWSEQVEQWYHHPEQAWISGGETLNDLCARAMPKVDPQRSDKSHCHQEGGKPASFLFSDQKQRPTLRWAT